MRAPASNPLTIQLLGAMRVLRGGESIPLPASRKTRALLAHLVLTGREHARDRLCSLLWPDVLAVSIPGARFVPLEGSNHILLEHEPAWSTFLSELRDFLSQRARGESPELDGAATPA